MLTRITIIILCAFLSAIPTEAAQPFKGKKANSHFDTIKDRALITNLVKEAKRVNSGWKLLKPSFFAQAYKFEGSCQGQEIYAISDNDISVPDELTNRDDRYFPNCGSGGCEIRIFLRNPKTRKVHQVFRDNLIDLISFDDQKPCANGWVVLHGSKFDRVGYGYGYAKLVFKDGKFKVETRNGKVSEHKDFELP